MLGLVGAAPAHVSAGNTWAATASIGFNEDHEFLGNRMPV
jgi:hypothetical protein